MTVLFWAGFILFIIWLMSVSDEYDRENCEARVAQKLGTTAHYIDGRCMVKGYGRFNE